MFKYFPRFSFVILLISALGFSGMTSLQAKEQPVILVLGDSLSAAYDIPIESGWASLLQEKLNKEGLSYRVLNESVSGDATSNGLFNMKKIVKREEISYMVLALGANDGLRGTPFEVTRNNLVQIMDLAKQDGAKILLVGINLPANYGAFYKTKFDAVYTDLAKERGIPLLPDLLIDVPKEEEYFLPDRLHPSEKAQPIILESVWRELRKIL